MGFLDRLAGRDTRAQAPEPEEAAAAEATTSGSSSEVLRDTAPTLGAFQPTQRLYDPYGKLMQLPCCPRLKKKSTRLGAATPVLLLCRAPKGPKA